MNTWEVTPLEMPFICFEIIEHKMIDKASDTEVDYISVIDFNQGKLLLDLVNE